MFNFKLCGQSIIVIYVSLCYKFWFYFDNSKLFNSFYRFQMLQLSAGPHVLKVLLYALFLVFFYQLWWVFFKNMESFMLNKIAN